MKGLIAAMGPHPVAYGRRNTHMDFVDAASKTHAEFMVIPDLVPERGRMVGMNAMREVATRRALDGGFDWLALADNDVRLTPRGFSHLVNTLLAGRLDVVVPRPWFPSHPMLDIIAYAPQPTRFAGVVKCVWSVISFTLWRRQALEKLGGVLLPVPASELAAMSHWRSAGLHVWMDLDHPADIIQLPKGFKARGQFVDNIKTKHAQHCIGRLHQIWHKPYETLWGCNKCRASIRFGPSRRTIEVLQERERTWESNPKYFKFTAEPGIDVLLLNGQSFRIRSPESLPDGGDGAIEAPPNTVTIG